MRNLAAQSSIWPGAALAALLLAQASHACAHWPDQPPTRWRIWATSSWRMAESSTTSGCPTLDGGFTKRYEYALQAVNDIPYGRWREYDPEDTIRFYALRLYEVGMIKTNPSKLIAQGTDWGFLNELKKELKA
jgi:hypothetical protein